MKIDYRSIARQAYANAAQELTSASDARVRYAALELRTAMEALVYERLLLYESELPEAELSIWQPKRVFEVLLDLDPFADKSSSFSMAPESSPGVQSGPFVNMGNERVITMKELKKYYDKLGSYLHAPTVQQARHGVNATSQMRQRCEEISSAISQILSSPIWSVDVKVVAEISCFECKKAIVCRMPRSPTESRTVNCTNCNAVYCVEPRESMEVEWRPLHQKLKCASEECGETCVIWPKEIKPGTYWKCCKCGGENKIIMVIAYEPPPRATTDAQDAPQAPSL